MMGWDFGWGWGWMFFGGLLMVVFWGGLIALLVLAVRWLTGAGTSVSRDKNDDHSSHNRGKTADEILQERYARGEITQSEYKEMSETLRH